MLRGARREKCKSMGMTMTQKILAAHAGLPEVKAGDLIEAKLDLVLGNDVTTPVAVSVFGPATAAAARCGRSWNCWTVCPRTRAMAL